jgi:hypothetical protein
MPSPGTTAMRFFSVDIATDDDIRSEGPFTTEVTEDTEKKWGDLRRPSSVCSVASVERSFAVIIKDSVWQ